MRVECDMRSSHRRGLRRFFIHVSNGDLYCAKNYVDDVDCVDSDYYSIERHRLCMEPRDIFEN